MSETERLSAEERSAFGIDHRQVFAAVLVQVGVAATAAGVLVSTNLYDPRDEAVVLVRPTPMRRPVATRPMRPARGGAR